MTLAIVNPMPALSDGREPVLTSGFGPRTGFHYGADLLYKKLPSESSAPPNSDGTWIVPDGVPALAAADGVVTKSSPISTGDRVQIDHGDGWKSGYFHLAGRKVNVGDQVSSGQPIGTVGAGTTHLTHLHFEVYQNGTPIDPKPFLISAPILPMPSGWFWVAVAAAGVGWVLYRYVF